MSRKKLSPGVAIFTFSGAYLFVLLQTIISSNGNQPIPQPLSQYYTFFFSMLGFLAMGIGIWVILRDFTKEQVT
jgi:hypothetical protein